MILANLDALLHRGEYRIAEDHLEPAATDTRAPGRFWKVLGMTPEFTRGDRLIYYLKLGWTGFLVITFLVGTIWALTFGVPASWWNAWWTFYVGLTALVGLITIIWFLWGGIIDLRRLVRDLEKEVPDETDDGTVPTKATFPQSQG